MAKILKAPWTRDQLDKLQKRQSRGDLHQYRCGKCGKGLIATPSGWACEGLVAQIKTCDYTQDWCYQSDAM